ncbi:MAG: DUF2231 domain-containing protein [Candidatus Nanopelagicales bacterium]
MFDTITGLPIHPLVVHAVIVLLPLACLGAVLVAAKASWNRRYGWLVLAFAFVALGSSVVAKESGEKLASRVGWPEDHIEWGEKIPIAAFGLFVLLVILWWLDRQGAERRTTLAKVVAALVIVAAAGSFALAVLAGHSGATAVWKTTIENTTPGSQPEPGKG